MSEMVMLNTIMHFFHSPGDYVMPAKHSGSEETPERSGSDCRMEAEHGLLCKRFYLGRKNQRRKLLFSGPAFRRRDKKALPLV